MRPISAIPLLMLGLALLSACASDPQPSSAPDDLSGLETVDGHIKVPSILRVDKFTAVYPEFRTDPHAGLAEIEESGRPGMVYYADPG